MIRTRRIQVRTEKLHEVRNISDLVSSAVLESRIRDGIATVYSVHTTASVYLANYDPSLEPDVLRILADLVPNHPDFEHNRAEASPPNADAHLKSILLGASVTIPVVAGRPAFGDWQAVYLAEFEGPRTRELIIQMMGE